jgi:hypothetical protein
MGSNGATPQREKVAFPTNEPVLLKLDYDDGVLSAGRFGDQYQYTFDGSTRIAWLDPDVRALILQSGAKAGDEIAIVKRESRQGAKKRVSWEVAKVEEDANAAYNAELAARDAQGSRSGPARERAAQLASAPRPAAAPPAQRPAQIPLDNTRHEQTLLHARLFADCILAAVHAAALSEDESNTVELHWGQDDIRAIATTIYIARSKGAL